MKFYGRLAPGISTDLATPLELILHMPRKATGVVVKVWERAEYVDIDGQLIKEDGGDDLLLELHGDVEIDPAQRKRGREKFVVKDVVHPPRDANAKLASLKLTIGDDPTVHEATIPSTEAEMVGQNFEIAITIEHAGSEVFKSKSPTFIRPALAAPRVIGKRVLEFGEAENEEPEWDEEDNVVLAGHYVTLGTATAETDDGHLLVTGFAWVDESGRLVPCDGDGNPKPGELIVLRTHKDLFAYVTSELPKKPIGDTSISLRLCHPVEPDGTIEIAKAHTNHLFGFTAVMEGVQ